MYHKILMAYDGSEGSNKALEHAISITKSNNGKLTLVHVEKENRRDPHNSLKSGSDMSVNFGGADVRAYERTSEEREYVPSDLKSDHSNHVIFSEAKRILGKSEIRATFEVLKGDPVKRMCNYAFYTNTDVIVIGSRGVGGIKKMMLGSISEKVAKEAELPVLIVK